MTAKNIKTVSENVRYSGFEEMPAAPSLSGAILTWSDEEAERRAAADPEAGLLPDGFWDQAVLVEPEGTEQITLRLPRRVLRHFKATGKGYQSRISAVLASYVDTPRKSG